MTIITQCIFAKPICFLLFLLAICSASSNLIGDDGVSLRTRFTATDVECTLYLIREHGEDNGHWVCGDMDNNKDTRLSSFSSLIINSEAIDIQFYISSTGARSESSTLFMSMVTVEYETASLYIPGDASFQVNVASSQQRRQQKNLTTGKFTSLIVRVIGQNGVEPISKDKLWETIVEDSNWWSMSEQYSACSHGKVEISPYGNSKDEGVINIIVDAPVIHNVTQRGELVNLAEAKLKEFSFFEDIDLLQYCLPAGTVRNKVGSLNWVGYAAGSKRSVVNDDLCGSVSIWMHEVGHNLGLGHSGTPEGEYGDHTCLMGTIFGEDNSDFLRQCFNAAKSSQLGWYANMELEIDPTTDFSAPSYAETYKMYGVDDYDKSKTTSDGLVILKMLDYYVGYNSKKGINAGVTQHADMIMILRKKDNKDSAIESSLGIGDSYTIEDFKSGRSITIKVVGQNTEGFAIIKVYDDENAPPDDEDFEITEGPCNPYESFVFEMEIAGDSYPEDISWKIEDPETGLVLLRADEYNLNWENYEENGETDIRVFCMPFNKNYKFTIMDQFGDGISGSQMGEGWYKATGPEGTLFVGGALGEDYDSSQSHSFSTVLLAPFTCDDDSNWSFNTPTQTCEWVGKKNGKALTNFCKKASYGKTVADFCPTTCLDSRCTFTCNDDPNWSFNTPKQTCNWVGKKTGNALANFCKKPSDGKTVTDFCPVACLDSRCSLCSDSKKPFKIQQKRYKCKDIRKNQCQKQTDKGKQIGKGPRVRELCPLKCNHCP